jgi:hypothetical protein
VCVCVRARAGPGESVEERQTGGGREGESRRHVGTEERGSGQRKPRQASNRLVYNNSSGPEISFLSARTRLCTYSNCLRSAVRRQRRIEKAMAIDKR